jgi:hypothetical protein
MIVTVRLITGVITVFSAAQVGSFAALAEDATGNAATPNPRSEAATPLTTTLFTKLRIAIPASFLRPPTAKSYRPRLARSKALGASRTCFLWTYHPFTPVV